MSFYTTVGPNNTPVTGLQACDSVKSATQLRSVVLIPAAIIIIILSFLRKRRSFKKDVCGARPGLVVPIDFLGIDDDRMTIMCIFGAAAESIYLLIVDRAEGKNAWETAFLGVGSCLEVAFLYYPYFGCLSSYHTFIGALMGLPYGFFHFTVELVVEVCSKYSSWQTSGMLPHLPGLICKLIIYGKFIGALYRGIKESCLRGGSVVHHRNKPSPHKVKLVRPWLINYVKDLVNPKSYQYTRIGSCLSKVYTPDKNFKFSTQTVSVMMVCFIVIYNISSSILVPSFKLLDKLNYNAIHDLVQTVMRSLAPNLDVRKMINPLTEALLWLCRGILFSLIVATVLAFVLCLMSIVRCLDNHKNNMLRMFRGDKSFVPSYINVSQFIIGKGLRYHCFQVVYFLWGYILLEVLLFVICFCFYSLKSPYIRDALLEFSKGAGVLAGVAIFTRLSLPLASFAVFCDREHPKNVISINNRNVYLLFSYFWFFVGLPMGFFSALFRLLKCMAVGALMMPRIDHSVMPDGFQRIDTGFNSYIYYLHVQAAYRNPVLRVFCQILSDSVSESQGQSVDIFGNIRQRKWTFSAQARARWFLALTLIRNPQLVSQRRQQAQATRLSVQCGYARQSDVEIEVRQYGSDSVKLIDYK